MGRCAILRDGVPLTVAGAVLQTNCEAAASAAEWLARGEVAELPKNPDGSNDEAAAARVQALWTTQEEQ